MDEKELARAVAAELGGSAAEDTDRALKGEIPTDATRAFDLGETMALGSFLASCAQLAVQVYHARQDRALLVEALLET